MHKHFFTNAFPGEGKGTLSNLPSSFVVDLQVIPYGCKVVNVDIIGPVTAK